MPRMRIITVATMAAALAVSGCGSGGSGKAAANSNTVKEVSATVTGTTSSSAPSPTTLGRGEFVAKANAICKRVNTYLGAVNIRTRAEYGTVLPELATHERVAFAELGKLAPPASLATAWKQLVTGGQALADDTTRLGEIIASHKSSASRALVDSANEIQKSMHGAARRAGVVQCAQFA